MERNSVTTSNGSNRYFVKDDIVSDTERNLEEAFSGESQARSMYTFFAEVAEKEGKPSVAKLFRSAAMAEKFHARNHFGTMGKLKSTKENLKDAAEGENYEHVEMYPEFIEKAKKEGGKAGLQNV